MKINFDSINVLRSLKNDEVLMYQEKSDEVILTPVKKCDISWGRKIQAFFGIGPYMLRTIAHLFSDMLQKLPTELPQDAISTLNARITSYNNHGLRKFFSCLHIGLIQLPESAKLPIEPPVLKDVQQPHTLDHLAITAQSEPAALHSLLQHAWTSMHRTPEIFAEDLPRYKNLLDAFLKLDDKEQVKKCLLAKNAAGHAPVAAVCLLKGQRWIVDQIFQAEVVDDDLLLEIISAPIHVGNQDQSILDYLFSEDDAASQALRNRIQSSSLLQENIQHPSLTLL